MNAPRLWQLLLIAGAVTLAGCSAPLQVAPAQPRNQFQSLPADATTPPEIRTFLPPFQSIVTKFEQQWQTLEQRLTDSETRLQDSLRSATSKPAR